MDERQYLADLSRKPFGSRIRGYMSLAGPGYLQSAMTLGGGSIASSVLMGSMLGYELLWVQPLAILLGYFVLAAVAKQTTHTQERPYKAFWDRLHPILAILWGISALVATVLWHIPQYSLAANGASELLLGIGLNVDAGPGVDFSAFGASDPVAWTRIALGLILLVCATAVVWLYNSGARGLRIYEQSVKTLVWLIVIAFAIVAFATDIQWGRMLMGITGINFIRIVMTDGVPPQAVIPIVGGIAAAVGINMVFLYPYSLLNKNWGKEYKELAYFDLISGMVIPYLVATGLMTIAVANTIGPDSALQVGEAVKDIREILPVLETTLGAALSLLLIGLGMLAIGFSTIITHMLASGFIGCELFGLPHAGKPRFLFSLLPAIGVIGVAIPFPWYAAVTASSLAAPLMPVAVLCFLILLLMPSYMGSETPRGGMKALWIFALCASILVLSVSAYFGLVGNWRALQENLLEAEEAEPAALETAEEVAAEDDIWNMDVAAPMLDVVRADLMHEAMGTDFTFALYGDTERMDQGALARAGELAFDAIDALEANISSWRPESDTSRVNAAAGGPPTQVGEDLIETLLASKSIWDETGGAFDVTVGPILDVWSIDTDAPRVPAPEELAAALGLVGMDKVEIAPEAQTVQLEKPGMSLNFGAIGKGLALDRAMLVLRESGVRNGLLSGGTSSIVAMGAPPGSMGWKVEIKDPYNGENASLDTIILRDAFLSTSAKHEKPRIIEGKEYSHIFDPRTGLPVEGLLSATVVAESGAAADALSTALFVMGPQAAEAWCQEHTSVRAVLVTAAEQGPLVRRLNFDPQEELT